MQEKKLLRLEGVVENIVYRNEENGYTVLELADGEDYITAVGIMPRVNVADTVVLIGTYKNHQNYGRQFSCETCEVSRPTETANILRYLISGAIKGVGPSTAKRLVESFGESTLDVMENDPDRVAQLRGISKEKANDFSEQLKSSAGIRTLMMYLGEFGISNSAAVKIFSALGSQSVERIKQNPYILSEGKFGISFETADFVAKKQQLEFDAPVRIRAGLTYILRHNFGNGHTCLPKNKLIELAVGFLGVSGESVSETLEQMLFERSLTEDKLDDKDFVFIPDMHSAEQYAASRLKMMLTLPADKIKNIDEAIEQCERESEITYAELQKKAITAALTESVIVLTGGPGTGKTTTLNAIISILENKGMKVLLAAPTGRAAQRMSELTGRDAKTLHRLLEVSWDREDNPVFSKNERNLLKCDAVVVDEMSMVDSKIFESFLRAIPVGCRLIMVGDSDQLPSVGVGNVLGDLIDSGVMPTVRLNEVFRQASESLIITNAHKIVAGELPDLTVRNNDFFFIRSSNKADTSEMIAQLCGKRLPGAYGFSPFEDIQVLCPSKKGELGTAELNHRLQFALNPPGEDKPEVTIGAKTFRVGDKVMQMKNDYEIRWERDNGEIGEGVFNGDIGIVKAVDKKQRRIIIDFYDKTASVSYESASDLDFAYAITVHKSQGNEFKAVILPLFPGTPLLYYRNLLYTAVTRAKEILIIIGAERTVEQMVNNNKHTKRYTALKHFLLRDDNIYI